MKQSYHKKSYIDFDIICREPLHPILRNLMRRCERADWDDPDLYFDYVDDFLVWTKNFCAEGELQWSTYRALWQKYYTHALKIDKEEEEAEKAE